LLKEEKIPLSELINYVNVEDFRGSRQVTDLQRSIHSWVSYQIQDNAGRRGELMEFQITSTSYLERAGKKKI
jgi:hypothetical protein